jgi:hypothetical protein
VAIAALNRLTYLRLVNTAENTLFALRTRIFEHVHRLSIAHHDESKRGVLVTRGPPTSRPWPSSHSGERSRIVNLTVAAGTLLVLALIRGSSRRGGGRSRRSCRSCASCNATRSRRTTTCAPRSGPR